MGMCCTTNLMRRFAAVWCVGGAMLLLPGCVFTPRTVTYRDAECAGVHREMVLDTVVISQYQRCNDARCQTAVLTGAAVVGAASLVVSGSIYVVGNVAYWAERKVNCRPDAQG